jgi:hypothetical protein
VGIFIGEGKFVHAAGHGKGVMISSLNDPYHTKHWAGARRFDLKQLPKVVDEMPILASEVIVEQPVSLVEPRGRVSTEGALSEAKQRATEEALILPQTPSFSRASGEGGGLALCGSGCAPYNPNAIHMRVLHFNLRAISPNLRHS